MPQELDVPPLTLTDPDSFELIRVWAAHGEQHVTISSDLGGGAIQFGLLLADLAKHGAKMYSQREGTALEPQLRAVLSGFLDHWREENPSLTGSIGHDG